jgi:hypothetical protein
MQCVYTGYLPNFFIPENNMFTGKIVGAQQINLFRNLETFYEKGVSFLLISPTLREILTPALSDPYFVLSTEECDLKSEIDIDMTFLIESYKIGHVINESNFSLNMMHLNVIDQLWTNCHNVIYHDGLVNVLQCVAMSLKAQKSGGHNNKIQTVDKNVIHMLGLVLKLGCASDGLYLALYLYDTGRFQTALTVTGRVKQKLSQSHIMYHGNVDRQRYSEAVGGQSMITKYRKAWARNILFYIDFTYIEELRLEQEVSDMNGIPLLQLSPFLVVHMLSVLCHYRLGNRSQYLQALTDLHTLLLYDDGTHVLPPNDRYKLWQLYEAHSHGLLSLQSQQMLSQIHSRLLKVEGIYVGYRELSWQILGICQHVVGDLHGALQSYHESITQKPYYRIQTATEYRMGLVRSQLG